MRPGVSAKHATRSVCVAALVLTATMLLSGCTSRSETRDAKLADDLRVEIESALSPGDDADKIDQLIREKGWPLTFVGRGYAGFVPNTGVSSQALRVHIVVDDKKRFVEAKVVPSPNLDRPLAPFDPR